MEANKLNILLTDEAKAFVRSLPEKARKKVTFNIRKVEGGEMDKDLFKKLNDDICGETGACWDSMGVIKQCQDLHFRAGRQD